VKWRIIHLEAHDAYTNMGIDESIMEAVRDRRASPTIRFYRWNPSAVSIGTFQGMDKEVNVQRCKDLGVDCIRRITGGGAVFHDFNGEITYSVIAPLQYFPQGIRESYQFICGWIISGLKKIGLDAGFAPINDINVDGKKISGNAQTRKQGVLLQHGTVLYDIDIKKMFSVLNVSAEKISDKMIKSAEERVTSVKKHSNVSIGELCDALIKGFTDGKDFEFGPLSGEESSRAAELARTVYRTDAWNFSR
jgi:lipoate-protein ligase A